MIHRLLLTALIVASPACDGSVLTSSDADTLQAASGSRQVAVWYRGSPQGQPVLEDLAAIRAVGFSAIVWPGGSAESREAARRMGEVAGLAVFAPGGPNGPAPGEIVRIVVAGQSPDRIAALAWRHVQEQAPVIAFDPGVAVGPGLEDSTGQQQPWVAPARAIARQLSINATLFDQLQPGPPVVVKTGASDLQVSLFQTPRSWVLLATNLDGHARRVDVELPPAVPAALWASLLDGSGMSMLSRPTGPLWREEIPGPGVVVYLIDKASDGLYP
jgi:hypothetical protein